MEEKIITGLKDLGYRGPLLQKGSLKSSIEYGSKSIEYTKLVNYLTTELRTLANLDEQVNPISSPEDSVSFMMEIGSFLKELNCPYQTLTQGHVSDRLQNVEDRELLLDYLIIELMTARMIQEKEPKKKIELKLQESPEAAVLKKILITLHFPKPPEDITVQKLFENMLPKIEDTIKRTGVGLIGKAFFSGVLTDKQWKMLSELQKDLNNDYKIRREMLLTRLDVTIQSFQWSNRTKGKEDYFEKNYKEERSQLHVEPNVDLSHLLAARTDLAIIEKTSSANVRKNTKTSIQKVIIGQVPDRGGRTNEIAPPPPEMPSWQQRTPGPPGGGRGGYNQGRGRGNFNQGSGRGNYNQSSGEQAYSGRGGNEERGNYNSRTNPGNYGGDRQSNYTAYDSAGTYDMNKRVKSYDSFRTDNASYSDQYVRDTQHNQQNNSRNEFARGRSEYRRGQGNRYNR